MEPKYLIDTNVLIDAQMNNLPETGMKFLKKIIDTDFTVSFITYIEFPGYREITKGTEGFISLSNVLEINKEIIQGCIRLRRTTAIKLPDAIIAATAISFGLHLITRNTGDFKNITKLKLIDPWNL